jgi:ligand-binding sensor domain-containing protein/serine phosphatase RsbU (regulator of sigma subunit)
MRLMPSKLPSAALAIAALAVPLSSAAQVGSVEPAPVLGPPDARAVEEREMPAPLSFDLIGLTEGLPQGSARAIVQDGRGYIWIGTEDGLARYDGHNMRVFRPRRDDPETLLGGWIMALAVGPDDRVWVGTTVGVSVYDPATDKFTRLEHDPEDPTSVSPGGVNDIFIDDEDAWLARIEGGLDRVDLETFETEWFTDEPLDGTVKAIAKAPDGKLWMGTEVGLVVLDPSTGDAEEFVPDEDAPHALGWTTVTTLYVDSAGVLWVGSEADGVFLIDPATGSWLRHEVHRPDDPQSISGDRITAFLEDRNQRMWIGTVTGLTRFDRATGTFSRYNHDPMNPRGLPAAWVESLFQDRGGVVWIGLNSLGIALFDELRIEFAHHRTRVTAMSLYEDPDGTIWTGTVSGGGLYRYDPNANTQTVYRRLGRLGDPNAVELSRARIWGLHRLRNDPDTLWIGTTEHGLIRFNPKTGDYKQYTSADYPGMTSDWIWGFWEAPDGMLWMATWGGGLLIFDPEYEEFTGYGTDRLPGLTSDALYALYADPVDEDLLWMGTGDGGLCRLDLATISVSCFTHDDEDPESLSSNAVVGIYRAPGGDLWVATLGEGLNRIDPDTGKAKRYTTDNSPLSTNTVYSILADGDDKLWVSSANGLYHIDPDTEEFIRYGAGDGLQSDEFAMLGAHAGRSGKLLFAGIGGFNVFDPSRIGPDDYAPPVAITGFRSFDDGVSLTSPIWTLPTIRVGHTSSFEFEFAALSFADPGSNRFAYKLEGFDSDWIEGRRFANYGRLGGGSYTLRVRAANRHGVWNEEGVSLAIRVTPAPWRTWWAYSLYGLAVLGGLAYYRRYNQQKLERLAQMNRLQAVERDLELTGAVQHGFLPATNSVDDGRLRMYGFYRAAEACGGDWWWHDQPAPGIHHILVGDVTGHGPGPAMVTAAVATAFRVQSNFAARSLSEKIDILNREVMLAGQGKYHMTLAAVELNEGDGSFTFYSAGSTPLLRLGQQGRARALPCRGTPLGTSSFELGAVHEQLEPGERLLIFTDGIPEIPISEDRLLGMRRFSKMYEQTREFGLEEALSTIVSAADRLRGGQVQDDDWTLVVVEWG